MPLEWNVVFAYTTIFLFLGFPNWNGYAPWNMTPPWLALVIAAALLFFPVLGNLRPDKVSFLPCDAAIRGQLGLGGVDVRTGRRAEAEPGHPHGVQPDRPVHRGRLRAEVGGDHPAEDNRVANHAQPGRGLYSLLLTHLPDIDVRTVREGEFVCNSLIGFNFGDGHLHDADMIRAVQREAGFEPGECVIAWVESEAFGSGVQHYQLIDAAMGVIERGTWKVADAVEEQPWLPNGPIPTEVSWSLPGTEPAARKIRTTGRSAGMSTAIVVGGGPNGLAAAISLAAEGVSVTVLEAADEVGGGTRSSEAIIPGLLHDHCSAIHPMAVGSQFFSRFDLQRYGLSWRWPEIDCVHPLDGGSAGVLHRSVEETAAGLGRDGSRWRRAFGYPAARFDALSDDIMRPLLRLPHHPLMLARFGAPTVLPASTFARLFRTDEGRALFGGVAAHAFRPLHYPMTSAIGMGIIAAGHRHGWPVAEGGSQSITNAMVALLGELGGKIETGIQVQTASQLPPADITMFDLAPSAVADILGDRLPRRVSRAFTKFRRGPGAFKVDFAVEGGVPWTNPDAHRAGTVHLAGTYRELAATERDIHAGRMPERPFVLVGQQYLADPQRSVGNVHPVWTYAHVPNGFSGDATAAIVDQIERFAPGFQERIVGQAFRTTTQFAAYNLNYVGGDIMTGAKDIRQLTFGPRTTLSPYTIGVPGMYICSAATPPGPGAHGMCGANAATLALSYLARRA